ncbi:peptidylprolyl isomerase [Nakamurella aerolata]|uniref:Peptidylprolyl isomerase n=1 Tax=Nakamurella aerolata TaxID=1656892 RepID=A0A849A2A3_9ACTN|nr:peptidylprolyl isomerase [Nakamurella aerolata]
MPSNQQRREAARRKLQRQLQRREAERARRRRVALISGSVAVVVIAAGVVWLVTANRNDNTNNTADAAGSSAAQSSAAPDNPCNYTPGGKAAKDVKPPTNVSPERTGTVDVTITMNGQPVEASLDRASAPCSVNAFLSLASQNFYSDTSCHRLTAAPTLNALQCGDPTGTGTGTPGYSFQPTPPTGDNVKYPVGTVAMATDGSMEGSQFFIVYGAAELPPQYSIIGKVSDAGMKVIDGIAAKGVQNNAQDGKPVAEAKIDSVTVPEQAVVATTAWPSSSAPSEPPMPPAPAPSGAGEASGSAPAGTGAAPASNN